MQGETDKQHDYCERCVNGLCPASQFIEKYVTTRWFQSVSLSITML